MGRMVTIESALTDPTLSYWFKDVLRSALKRDPVDAATELELLASLLNQRCDEVAADGGTVLRALPT